MAGVMLENISTKKLVIICLFLLSISLFTFILSGLIVPSQMHHQPVTATWCIRQKDKEDKDWYPSRGEGACQAISGMDDPIIQEKHITTNDIRFSFQYPLPRDMMDLTMSRWFMYHVAVLSFTINYQTDKEDNPKDGALIELQVRVGYKDGNSTKWTEYISGDVKRRLRCEDMPEEHQKPGYQLHCEVAELFEIGMHHDSYLVNIKMPPNFDTGHNMDITDLDSLDLVWFAQTGGFTLYFLVMKSIFFVMILPLTVWNWKRVVVLKRPLVFSEKLLLALASCAIILNLPVDWLMLVVGMEFLLLWNAIRQGLFLSLLLCYFLRFTEDQVIDDVKRSGWKKFWKNLAEAILACAFTSMFVFDVCLRVLKLGDPLFSIWSPPQGITLGKASMGIAMAAGIVYVIILIVFTSRSVYNMWQNRKAFEAIANGRSIHYMTIIYRSFFTLLFTAVCSLLTVVAFIMERKYESQWKWDFDYELLEKEWLQEGYSLTKYLPNKFEVNTAIQLGVYATWNVYVIAMLIFYAQSSNASSAEDIHGMDADGNDQTVEQPAIFASSDGVGTQAKASASNQIVDGDDQTDDKTTLTTESNLTS